MAMRGTTNIISALPKRLASSAAAAQEQGKRASAVLPRQPFRVTKLDNGIVVASLENNSAATRIAAVVNASSRDELTNERGAAHALRAYANLATRNYSAFGVTRRLNQLGADLSVTSSREQTTYLLESTRSNAAKGVDILGEVLSRPEFRHWEIDDSHARLTFDLDVFDEQAELQLVELIHRASFKGGLANSLYAPRYNVGNLDGDVLHEFRRRNFTSNRLTLIGVGVRHEDLLRYADFFRLPAAAPNAARSKSTFLPTEIRNENLSDLVHVALATEGAASSSKDALATSLLQHALGTSGQRIKYSSSNKLNRALLPLAAAPASVSAFNFNYSDAGLFGFHVVADSSDAGKLTTSLLKELANLSKNGLTANELTAAKNSLKLAVADSVENPVRLIERVGQRPEQALVESNTDELFKQIDAVSANDVNALLKRVAGGKFSLTAIGNLSEVPRLGELQ